MPHLTMGEWFWIGVGIVALFCTVYMVPAFRWNSDRTGDCACETDSLPPKRSPGQGA
jgi:hypothetical protein